MYQVLLQYRAARHMDLVQFMQQVHIFNQLMVSSLTKTSNCVLLERIDPQQTNPELLGPQRLSVWKLPFRLDEIPYFDTSYLCDPDAAPKLSGYDSDDESWDAPLLRRNNVSAKITESTNVARHGGTGRATPNLYSKQFSRDPSNVPMDRRGSSPMVPPSDHHYNKSSLRPVVSDRIGEFNSFPNEQYGVYKKRSHAPPPPPPTAYKSPSYDKNSQKKRQAPRPPKTETVEFDESSFENRHATKTNEKPSINPVREMQLLATSSGSGHARDGNGDENEPPFNFQGMLRKTQYNRASMKRNKNLAPSPSRQRDSPIVTINPPNVVYHSKDRKDRQERPKSCVSMTIDENENYLGVKKSTGRKYSLQQEKLEGKSWSDDFTNNNNNKDLDDDEFTPETAENYIKEEIAPGIILEGLVEEV